MPVRTSSEGSHNIGIFHYCSCQLLLVPQVTLFLTHKFDRSVVHPLRINALSSPRRDLSIGAEANRPSDAVGSLFVAGSTETSG